MALDPKAMAASMSNNVKLLAAAGPITDPDLVWLALAQAIVSHITGDAVVIADTMTSPSGPVTGTGKVT